MRDFMLRVFAASGVGTSTGANTLTVNTKINSVAFKRLISSIGTLRDPVPTTVNQQETPRAGVPRRWANLAYPASQCVNESGGGTALAVFLKKGKMSACGHAKAHIANSDNRARAIKRIVNNIPSNPGQGIKWRSATASDLEAIQKIASIAHPKLSERPEIFAEKLNLFPEGCFVLVQVRIVVGYAFVHPSHLNDIPKLDEFLQSLPTNPDSLMIHAVVVLQQARGKGASQSLVDLISRPAKRRNIQFLTLVSVYGTSQMQGLADRLSGLKAPPITGSDGTVRGD